MNFNEYEEIINGEKTYKEISKQLKENKMVGIGWSDEESTHFDILFKLGFEKYGFFQRGIRNSNLVVCIIDYTSYAFSVDDIKYGNYIQTKLRFNNDCGDKVAELINGIILELNGDKNEER